jgi:hypothetical protein
MKSNKIRTLIAVGALGAVAITGLFAVSSASAQPGDQTAQAAQGKGAFIKSLTPDQRACLKSNGVARPDHKLTTEERATAKANLEAATATCGVTLPTRPAVAKLKDLRADIKALSADQKNCLKTNGITKPDHRLTNTERQAAHAALEAAAQTCGSALS